MCEKSLMRFWLMIVMCFNSLCFVTVYLAEDGSAEEADLSDEICVFCVEVFCHNVRHDFLAAS